MNDFSRYEEESHGIPEGMSDPRPPPAFPYDPKVVDRAIEAGWIDSGLFDSVPYGQDGRWPKREENLGRAIFHVLAVLEHAEELETHGELIEFAARGLRESEPVGLTGNYSERLEEFAGFMDGASQAFRAAAREELGYLMALQRAVGGGGS